MNNFLKAGLLVCILAAPALVHAGENPGDIGVTTGRLQSLMSGALGLISVIIGGLALRSSASMAFKKTGTLVAMLAGSVCVILSIMHLARATGNFGTGSGKLGAIVALVLGLLGIVLGGLAKKRAITK